MKRWHLFPVLSLLCLSAAGFQKDFIARIAKLRHQRQHIGLCQRFATLCTGRVNRRESAAVATADGGHAGRTEQSGGGSV